MCGCVAGKSGLRIPDLIYMGAGIFLLFLREGNNAIVFDLAHIVTL